MIEIKDLLIEEDETIVSALEQLDVSAHRILFLHENGTLKATLTDGDVRRYILKNGDLNDSVSKAANYQPKYLINANRDEADKFMKINSITALPIIDESGKILRIQTWDETVIRTKATLQTVPVVMMAGGLGTRLYPYTQILPKALIPVGEIPISEHIMDQFHEFGCKKFYMVVNHKKNMIKAYYSEVDKDYQIEFVDEEEPLGTGGGLSLLKGKLESTFIFTNCDILIDHDMNKIYSQHKSTQSFATMICSMKNYSIPYGVVNVDESGAIKSMEEKPTFSFLTNTGCYFVEPDLIDLIPDKTKIDFPDLLTNWQDHGERVSVYPISDKSWHDMGNMDGFEKMRTNLDDDDK